MEVRRRIGMVFQKPNPFPKSIYDNIAFGPRIAGYKGNMDELVEESLRGAALWDEVKDKLKESAMALSGGQQQRLCIARAIAIEPDVILMDEPCSALDPIATARIEDLMQELEADYTIVIVTHNMQQAARVSDRTAFFTVEVADDGTPDRHARRVRPHRDDLHQPERSAHRGLRHGEVRMTRRSFHEELERDRARDLSTMGELAERPSVRVGGALVRARRCARGGGDRRRRRRDRRALHRHRAPTHPAAGAADAGGDRPPAGLGHPAHQPAPRAHRRQAVNIAKIYLSAPRHPAKRGDAFSRSGDGRRRRAHDPDGHGGLLARAIWSCACRLPEMDDPVDRLNLGMY